MSAKDNHVRPAPTEYIFGSRLTQYGFAKMKLTNPNVHKFKMPTAKPGRLIVKFTDIDVPFYVSKDSKYIYFFDDGVAFLINLYGSVEEWLQKF